MPPKTLMTASAALFAALGAITFFFQEELVAAAGLHPTAALPVPPTRQINLLPSTNGCAANPHWGGSVW